MDNAEVVFGSSFPSDQEYTQVIIFISVCWVHNAAFSNGGLIK